MAEGAEFLPALRALLARQLEAPNAFYAPRLRDAGLAEPGSVSVSDFVARCPVTTKAEIAADHAAHPPFGSNLTLPVAEYPRLCRTSGTTGEPISWLDSAADWEAMLDLWEAIFRAAGIAPGDRIYFAFSFGPFLGFWTAFEAAARMGCMALPGGGLSTAARLAAMGDLGATALCCTPTYALRLGEAKAAPLGVRTIVVAGEPGGSVPAVREAISRAWNGARVIDHHGMTEVGPVSVEHPQIPGLLCAVPGGHLVEVVDPATGEAVGEGAEGELVLTTLRRHDHPLLRYRTGDLVRKRAAELGGEATVGFEGGILGRIDDMVVVRGVNLYPAAVDAVVRRFDSVAEYQVALTRERAMDEVALRVELKPGAASDSLDAIASALREAFSLRIPVSGVPADSLPRHEFKARRWIRE